MTKGKGAIINIKLKKKLKLNTQQIFPYDVFQKSQILPKSIDSFHFDIYFSSHYPTLFLRKKPFLLSFCSEILDEK